MALSASSRQSFDALVAAIESETLEAADKALRAESAKSSARSGSFGGSFAVACDQAVAGLLEQAASRMYEQLIKVHRAEPDLTDLQRAANLTSMLMPKIDALGRRLQELRDNIIERLVRKPLSRQLKMLSSVHDRLHLQYPAEVDLAIKSIANTGFVPALMQNTINVNGPVGALQTGANSTAQVQQTLSGTSDAALMAAFDTVVAALQQAMSLPAEQREQAAQVVVELRKEAALAAPNKIKVLGLLGAVGTTIQTIANVEPAWKQIAEWGSKLLGG